MRSGTVATAAAATTTATPVPRIILVRESDARF